MKSRRIGSPADSSSRRGFLLVNGSPDLQGVPGNGIPQNQPGIAGDLAPDDGRGSFLVGFVRRGRSLHRSSCAQSRVSGPRIRFSPVKGIPVKRQSAQPAASPTRIACAPSWARRYCRRFDRRIAGPFERSSWGSRSRHGLNRFSEKDRRSCAENGRPIS